ncbi:hypothetical protein OAN61_00745 [bacterium]|nr:hypothetical protein [bacterium]
MAALHPLLRAVAICAFMRCLQDRLLAADEMGSATVWSSIGYSNAFEVRAAALLYLLPDFASVHLRASQLRDCVAQIATKVKNDKVYRFSCADEVCFVTPCSAQAFVAAVSFYKSATHVRRPAGFPAALDICAGSSDPRIQQ